MPSDADRKSDREKDGEGRIKITDRRHFTPAGEPREAAAAAAEDVPPETAPAAAEASPREAAPPEPAGPGPSIDFTAFVQSLYIGALMALGEVENPYTRQFETNLDLARQNIDILVMLREKTAGNLTAEEDGFLEQFVPQLQILYVKKVR